MGSGTTTLAATAYDWVGGNFAGLLALQGQCGQVASTIAGADQALSRQVAGIVGAGNWTGAAASAFTSAWDQGSTAGAQLADGWKRIGTIAGNLAADLASLENALEQAASQLEQQGVAVNRADGSALPDTTASGLACPSPQVAAANARLAAPYMAYRAQILEDASAARAQAALSLNAIAESMLPGQPDWGDPVNGLDAVRGLWAVPTTYRREVAADLTNAEKSVNVSQRALWEQLIERRKVSGNAARVNPDDVAEASRALNERSALQGKLANAPKGGVDTMLADGDAGGLGLAGAAAGAVRAIPYLGATAGAGITIGQDREQGESWGQSVSDGVVSNAAALGAGLAVAGVIGAGSVGAVAAGVLVGGAVAVGVGDFVHAAFQENWGADIQAYGVAGGIVHGLGDTASATGHSVQHLYDDITSLF
jgi:uncharacterized protein YukE